jgi:hypothetical protein
VAFDQAQGTPIQSAARAAESASARKRRLSAAQPRPVGVRTAGKPNCASGNCVLSKPRTAMNQAAKASRLPISACQTSKTVPGLPWISK